MNVCLAFALFLFVVGKSVHIEGLKCGITKEFTEGEIQHVMQMCIKSSHADHKHTSNGTASTESEESSSETSKEASGHKHERHRRSKQNAAVDFGSSETDSSPGEKHSNMQVAVTTSPQGQHIVGFSRSSNKLEANHHNNGSASRTLRMKRSFRYIAALDRSGSTNGQNEETKETGSMRSISLENVDKADQNSTEKSDNCIVQCFLQHLEMTDDKGYPQQQKVSQELLKTATERVLRDFLQDSTDECFQSLEKGDKLDSCEYSTQLVTCLADKGRSNCSDWPTGNLPFQHNA